jgi:IS30 family transposase
MERYRHLTLRERERISIWKSRGVSLREIANQLGRHPSTLSREVNRNRNFNGYWPSTAHERAQKRERTGHKRIRLKDQAIRHEVERMLSKGWSPELVAGRLRRERPHWPQICHEAIYQWLYAERPDLVGYLLRAHPKRRRRWKVSKRKIRIPDRVSIQKRPDYINRRQQPGHWETDLVVGPGPAAIQVAVERTSRLTRISKVPQKTARESRLALQRMFRPLPARLRQSVTYDNGSENAEHQVLNANLGMRSWFCEPYHSWEKGQVENTNGLIRRFVPKRTRLDAIPDEKIMQVEDWMNERPRKVLQFRTPNEVFNAWCCT